MGVLREAPSHSLCSHYILGTIQNDGVDHKCPEGRELVYHGLGGYSAPCTEPSILWMWSVEEEHSLALFPVAVSGLSLCDCLWARAPPLPPSSLPHLALPLNGLWSKKAMKEAVAMSKRPDLV